MKDKLFDALKRNTVDYAEIRVEFLESTNLLYRGRDVENALSTSEQGGIVRACWKGGWGIVSFDSLDNLGERVEEACICAKLVGKEKTQLAEVESFSIECPAEMEKDFRDLPVDEKIRLIRKYNDIILKTDDLIMSSICSWDDMFRTIYFASSRGTYFMEERPKVSSKFGAIARQGDLIQMAIDSIASSVTYDLLYGIESRVEECAKLAISLLEAPKVESGPQKNVILDSVMGGVFIHEAFGHLSEADFQYENPDMLKLMEIGRELGPENLNVVDDGSIKKTVGSIIFDEEGSPPEKTYLIKDGKLSGRLHSIETAGKMGEKPTGNARAAGKGLPPVVRMTNTYIENGDMKKEELFSGVDKGIYACGFIGGMTELEMFTFSASHGYRIENGEKGELVRDIVLTGNVFETLKSIDGIADDLIIREDAAGCGKMGQGGLPVTFGSPHLRIRDVIIG
jgi:predicted Zn-dependent protease